jgi:hypothetical protein
MDIAICALHDALLFLHIWTEAQQEPAAREWGRGTTTVNVIFCNVVIEGRTDMYNHVVETLAHGYLCVALLVFRIHSLQNLILQSILCIHGTYL